MKRIMKPGLLFILLCGWVLSTYAQANRESLYGQVTDSLSKQALPHATIQLQGITDTAFRHSTLTDAAGKFVFTEVPQGVYALQVQYIGYKTYIRDSLRIVPGHIQEPLQIVLPLAGKSLSSVTVTASKPYIEIEADKLVLNIASSPVAAGSNGYDVLAAAPGITEDNNALQFRGKPVTVLINGRPSHLSGEALKQMLSGMPANSIEKIELISNPSARYDAQGGAVVNIRLAKNKNYGTNGTLTAGAGTGRYGRYNGGISLNNRYKNRNLYGSYNYNHSTVYQENRTDRILPSATIQEDEYGLRYRDNHSYQLGLDYDINKKNFLGILIKGYVNDQRRRVENGTFYDHTNLADSSSAVFTKGNARYASPSVNVFYRSVLNNKGKEISVNADYFSYKKSWNSHFTTRYYDEEGVEYTDPYLLKDHSPSDIDVWAFSADYIHPSKIGKWETGIKSTLSTTDNNTEWHFRDGANWKTDFGKTNHFIYKETIHAGYLQYSKMWKQKYQLQAGLRAEYTVAEGNSVSQQLVNRNSYWNLFPTVSFLYMQSASKQWMAAYRKSINRYGFDFVNPAILYQSQYSYLQGNPYLRPQLDHSVELMFIYKYQWIAALNYMHSRQALAPVYRSDGNLLISSYDNLGQYNIATLTLTLNKTIGKIWTTVTTLGEFYIDIQTKGQENSTRAFSTYLNTKNTIRLPKKFTFEVSAMYRSAFASGIFKVNDFFYVNSGVSKSLWNGKASLALNVSDIFNTRRFENTVQNYQQVQGTFINKPETRFVNLVFTLHFGNKNVKAGKQRKTGIEDIKARTNSL